MSEQMSKEDMVKEAVEEAKAKAAEEAAKEAEEPTEESDSGAQEEAEASCDTAEDADQSEEGADGSRRRKLPVILQSQRKRSSSARRIRKTKRTRRSTSLQIV